MKNSDNDEIIRTRLWAKPDSFLLSKSEFKDNFPNDNYNEEDILLNLKKDKLCEEFEFDTSKNKDYQFKKDNFDGLGYYLVEMFSKDKSGNEIKDIKYITVLDSKSDIVPITTSNWFFVDDKKDYQPGDELNILLGSSLEETNLLLEIKFNDKIIKKEVISLEENEQKNIKFKIEEKYRGGLTVNMVAVALNRVISESKNIKIPWTNKKLKYSIEHFRDKLKPGEKEEWKIKISGYKDEKVISELLLTMYDASLDYFNKHSLNKNNFSSIFKNNKSHNHWQHRHYFDVNRKNSIGKFKNRIQPKKNIYRSFSKFKDMKFLNFGYGIGRSDRLLSMGQSRSKGIQAVSLESSASSDANSLKKPSASIEEKKSSNEKKNSKQKIRKNFNETAFFYPNLTTDENGEITVSFTVPESLTKWNILGFAHTKELEHIFFDKELITQKQLMVIPSFPRFFRRGDEITLTGKVKNLSENSLFYSSPQHSIYEFFNPETGETVSIPNSPNPVSSSTREIKKDGTLPLNLYNSKIPESYKLDIIGCKVSFKAKDDKGNIFIDVE